MSRTAMVGRRERERERETGSGKTACVTISVIAATFSQRGAVAFHQLLRKCAQPIHPATPAPYVPFYTHVCFTCVCAGSVILFQRRHSAQLPAVTSPPRTSKEKFRRSLHRPPAQIITVSASSPRWKLARLRWKLLENMFVRFLHRGRGDATRRGKRSAERLAVTIDPIGRLGEICWRWRTWNAVEDPLVGLIESKWQLRRVLFSG